MKPSKAQNSKPDPLRSLLNPLLSSHGSVLAYLVVVILIFGVLGVIIVSLFTTSTTSSATPNDVRRAEYIAESAKRCAVSELRNTNFEPDTINDLNSLTYNLEPSGSFTVNVFGPWFESTAQYDYSGGSTITVSVTEGKIPDGFTIPAYIWVINYEYMDADALDITKARDPVASFTKVNDTTLTLTTDGDFHLEPGDRLCLAVKPESTQTISEGGDLLVENTAADVFPAENGAININRIDYVYEKLVDEGSRARLVKVTASSMPNQLTPFPLTVENTANGSGTYTGDFIVLSPRNHIIIPSVTVGAVTFTGTLEDGINVYDTFPAQAMTRKPDIEFAAESDLPASLTQKETDSGFVNVDNTEKTIDIGGGGSASNQFGNTWYNDDRAIGGDTNYCTAGQCLFKIGIRAFFTLAYSGNGEGLTFSLLNGDLNSHASAGGDIDLPELLGYGGDSRTKTNPAVGSDYLDGSGLGLRPPKIAVEFDTRTENTNFQYCNPAVSSDPAHIQQNTRNDPLTSDRDAVQYVFWGSKNLTIACRNDEPSYDDNRHDPGESQQNWAKSGLGLLRSTPAVTADGSVIYVGSDNGNLYAINAETEATIWTYPTGGPVRSSPTIGADGTIYVGSDDGKVYAINPDGTEMWSYSTGNRVRSTPAIGSDGTVYVGSDNGQVYAFNPVSGAVKWTYDTLVSISLGRPAIDTTRNDRIHVATAGHKIFALDPTDRQFHYENGGRPFPTANEWEFNLTDNNYYAPGINPTSGVIYSDISGNSLVAINPDGSTKWQVYVDADIDSTPVVGSDGRIYFGTDGGTVSGVWHNGMLIALDPNDRESGLSFPTANEWAFGTGGEVDTTPAIAADGTILVVSNDDNLYAVNPNGTEKWRFPIPVTPDEVNGLPISSPTVAGNGVVYVGSSDGNLYAINDFSLPRNIKEKMITSTEGVSPVRVAGEPVEVDSENNWLKGKPSDTDIGPWAVRLEVMRSDTANGNGNYEYTLHAWVRQCGQADCNDVLGTFYEDTRIQYATTSQRPVHLEQTIELSPADHTDFYRFLFGFTGAVAAGDTQSAVIDHFQLSFIRPNDPIITTDPDWPAP